MNTKFWGGVGGGGVGVGGGVGYYNFPRSTNKIKSFDEISTSEKIIFFCIFLLWGRVKLYFRNRYGKPNIYSKNSSCYQVFSSNSQKLSLWCKNKLIIHANGFVWVTHIKAPPLFPRRILISQGVLTKFHILTKFPHLKKICQFNERLKI